MALEREIKLRFDSADEARGEDSRARRHAAARPPAAGRRAARHRGRAAPAPALDAARAIGGRQEPAHLQGPGAARPDQDPRGARNGRRRRRRAARHSRSARPAHLVPLREVPRGILGRRRGAWRSTRRRSACSSRSRAAKTRIHAAAARARQDAGRLHHRLVPLPVPAASRRERPGRARHGVRRLPPSARRAGGRAANDRPVATGRRWC